MKIMLRLFLMMAVMLSLYSCVHDEIYSSSDSASQEYTHKSLWREDEKYIKNVKKVFEEYADKSYFAANFGEVYWDYATTMGTYNESLLEAPVIKNGKINFILLVYREEDRIFFKRKEEESSKDFFASLVFTDREKHKVTGRILNNCSASSKSICYTTETTVEWTNDDGTPGPTYTFSETHCSSTGPYLPCQAVDQGATCGGGHGNGGSGGSGGGGNTGYPYPPVTQNPCEKIKAQNNAAFKNKVDDLKSKLTLKKETGYTENNTGTFTYKDNASATENANTLALPRTDMYKDIKGYMHTHPNNFEDSDGNMRIGFKIFSPADVMYFNAMVKNALENGLPLDNVYAVMVSSAGTYQIRFTGSANQIKTTYANTDIQYNEMYKEYFKQNSKRSDEMNFLKFIDEQMYVKGISLVKMNDNGTFTTKTLNSDKSGVADSDCPN